MLNSSTDKQSFQLVLRAITSRLQWLVEEYNQQKKYDLGRIIIIDDLIDF